MDKQIADATLPSNPITLEITRESREEAIIHFKVLFRHKGKPRYFNSSIDAIALMTWSVYQLPRELVRKIWNTNSILDHVTNLESRLLQTNVPSLRREWEDREARLEARTLSAMMQKSLISWFPNLKIVTVTQESGWMNSETNHYQRYPRLRKELWAVLEGLLRGELERVKAVDDKIVLPEIIICGRKLCIEGNSPT